MIKKNEIGGACGTYRGPYRYIKVWCGGPERKKLFEKPRHR
jgi:hypothetical protein